MRNASHPRYVVRLHGKFCYAPTKEMKAHGFRFLVLGHELTDAALRQVDELNEKWDLVRENRKQTLANAIIAPAPAATWNAVAPLPGWDPVRPNAFTVEPRGVPGAQAARRLGLTEAKFLGLLPDLIDRGFPAPDKTTGMYDLKKIDAWMDQQA